MHNDMSSCLPFEIISRWNDTEQVILLHLRWVDLGTMQSKPYKIYKRFSFVVFCYAFIIASLWRIIYMPLLGWHGIDSWPNHKNIERRTAHTIASWPNPKQLQMGHTSDLIMKIRWSTGIFTIIVREMCELNTHSPIHSMWGDWENWLNQNIA